MAKTKRTNTEGMPNASPDVASKDASKVVASKDEAEEILDGSIEGVPQVESGKADAVEDANPGVPQSTDDDEPSLEDQLAAERDRYLRLAAEYDNYRKRSAKEREMTYSDARIESVTKLLPIYDNLERALQMECADEAFYKGIEMILTQFNEMFESMGVKHIPAVGEPFDPKFHNAVQMIIDPELGENIVAEEYQKGFTLGTRIIRFSTVVVAN